MDDIRAVMDACDSERAVLLGVSEGAPMCALFAATYPERTVGVILYGGYAKGVPAEDYPWAPTREGQLADIAREEDSWGAWTDDELLDFAPSMAGDVRLFDWLRKLFRTGASPAASRALSMMNMEVDISDILPAIRVPALVLHRTDDRLCKVEEGRYLAERIPGVRYVELPGEDHIPWVGRTSDSIIREIQTFATQTWREVEPDRVLATVMFTDIVGSTAKAATLGDPVGRTSSANITLGSEPALPAIAAPNWIRQGTDSSPSSTDPRERSTARSQIHRALAEIGLEARAGCTRRVRTDRRQGAAASPSIVGARVASLAGPADVLVSQTVKDLTAGSGLTFEDAGEHELKGIPDRWHLYRVAG